MSDDPANPSPESTPPPHGPGPHTQQFQHAPVGARLPDRVAAGVLSTGVIVMEGPEEFVLDFLQAMGRPPRLVARVVLSPGVMSGFVAALQQNLRMYEQAFGPPKPMPAPVVERQPTIEEVYQDVKVPEELLGGVYANTVMIGHSPAEFSLDFITRFFPTAAVSARVYLSASQVPKVLAALTNSMQNRLKRQSEPKKEPPTGQEP